MDSASLLASMSTLSCVALALAVGLRRERSVVASTAVALLAALALWAGGAGIAHRMESGPGQTTALRTAALGMFTASGLWLLLALRHRWPRRLGGTAATAAALAPAVLLAVAAITDASQGRVLWPDPRWHDDRIGWTGPLTQTAIGLAFGCGTAGTSLFLWSAARLWRVGEVRSAIAIGTVMLAQPIVLFAALRSAASPTPYAAASLTLATLVLAVTVLRYQLVQPPPLGHREVIDHLRDGVLMANGLGDILDHNAGAERLLGGDPRGRAIADAISGLAPDETRPAIRAVLARLEEAPEPVSLRFESSRDRHLEVSVRPILGDQGRMLGQVATLRDRTEERRYAESALRTQQLETVGTLAAGIAHEVNNPLAFVRANLGEIVRLAEVVDAWQSKAGKHESRLARELAEMGELARESLEGLGRIQRAVSDVRRLAAAPIAGHGSVSLETVVRDAVRLLELRAGGRVQVETRLAPGTPEIKGSAQLLVQAVLSLLLDSQQALEAAVAPRIEIEIGVDASAAWVRVRDNGPPVPDELRERIFEPGFSAGAPSGRGRGLGLSVAAGIAVDHGGSLRAEPCESGAAFLLRLARVG